MKKIIRKVEPLAPVSLMICLTGCFSLQPLSTDSYLPALPMIGEALSATPAQVQHTLSFFILSFALSQLLVGPLSDRIGRRPVALAGLVAYLSGSLLGWFAGDLFLLVVARVVQAFGVACTVLTSRAIVRDLYEPAAGAQILAKTNSAMAFVIVLSPILSGHLVAWLGWRASFALLSVCGASMLLLAWLHLRESNQHLNPHATDWAPMRANFLRIFAHGGFRRAVAVLSLTYGLIFCFLSGASYLFTKVLGHPIQTFGYYWGIACMGFLIGSFSATKAIARHGVIGTLRRAVVYSIVGGICMAALAFAQVHHPLAVVVPMFIVLMGHSRLNPCLQTLSTAPFPDNAGAASALAGFIMHVVAACIGWVLSLTFNDTVYPMVIGISTLTVLLAITVWTLFPAEPRAS
jgi:MFS transporter, DHA1 family, multidrug resistance protein